MGEGLRYMGEDYGLGVDGRVVSFAVNLLIVMIGFERLEIL